MRTNPQPASQPIEALPDAALAPSARVVAHQPSQPALHSQPGPPMRTQPVPMQPASRPGQPSNAHPPVAASLAPPLSQPPKHLSPHGPVQQALPVQRLPLQQPSGS